MDSRIGRIIDGKTDRRIYYDLTDGGAKKLMEESPKVAWAKFSTLS
jgi:hypothetical protein